MMKFWKKGSVRSKKSTARGLKRAPRRQVQPLWRHRWSHLVVLGLTVISLSAGGWWLWRNGWIDRTVENVKWQLIAASGDLGFTVDEVLVVGRNQTTKNQLLKAVKLVRGAPILAYDLEASRQRIEALVWVKSATVERMLPDTILVNIKERVPLALWQDRGRFHLIDQEGKIILNKGLERFSDLLVVVGDDAPENTATLLNLLQTQPHLMGLVESASRVGNRRWNVRLRGGVDVRLPAKDASVAWSSLAEYERDHGVLTRGIRILDLRLPDRLIIRKSPTTATAKAVAGQET